MSQPPNRKCADCGYLTLRNQKTGQLDEMDSLFRAKAAQPKRKVPASPEVVEYYEYPHKVIPICFVQAFPLAEEAWGEAGEAVRDADSEPPIRDTREVIKKLRPCGDFTKWQQGFTPKEHREMMDREKMLKWQAEREDSDRKWRDDQARKEEAWREGQNDKEGNRHFREMGILLLGIIVAASITLIAAFIGSNVPDVINQIDVPAPIVVFDTSLTATPTTVVEAPE